MSFRLSYHSGDVDSKLRSLAPCVQVRFSGQPGGQLRSYGRCGRDVRSELSFTNQI